MDHKGGGRSEEHWITINSAAICVGSIVHFSSSLWEGNQPWIFKICHKQVLKEKFVLSLIT